jgi:hypothetical protein
MRVRSILVASLLLDFGAAGLTYAGAPDSASPRLAPDMAPYGGSDFAGNAPARGVDLEFGYRLDPSGHFTPYDPESGAGSLFLSTSGPTSPYASLVNGFDDFGSIAVSDNTHLQFGAFALGPQNSDDNSVSYPGQLQSYDLRRAQAGFAGLDWDFASWGGLGIAATQFSERSGLIGGVNANALSSMRAAAASAGVSAHAGLGDGWVTTISYNQGITQLDLKPRAFGDSQQTAHSSAYAITVAKHGLFGSDDTLGLAVSRPLEGSPDLAAIDALATSAGVRWSHNDSLGSAPETDLELGYVTTFLDGSLALQANAGYQMNLEGQSGAKSVSVISRAKLKF